MGHTLTAVWDRAELQKVEELLARESRTALNKIPFGRDCDREAADQVLPYHMTVFHWSRHYDARFLRALEWYSFRPFRIRITDARLMEAEEQSWILYLCVEPDAGFGVFRNGLEERLGTTITSFLHITLAVDKDRDELKRLRDRLREQIKFPFSIAVSGLELYHIWRPVRYVRSWPQRDPE